MINYKELNKYRTEEGGVDMCKALEDIKWEGCQRSVEVNKKLMCKKL